MIYLVLCILSSSAIIIIFKSVDHFKGNTFHTILINYIVATVMGLLISGRNISNLFDDQFTWIYSALVLGVLFILIFYLLGKSVQSAGISATTVAARMSVIIPILFSILYFDESVTIRKITGVILALFAVFFTIYQRNNKQKMKLPLKLFLPLIIFIGTGLIDSLVKYSQHTFLNDSVLPVFSSFIFLVSLIIGMTIFLIRKENFSSLFNKSSVFWGSLLGIVNFGSIYFFVNALSKSNLDSSIVFGINHIGIVAFSVLLALILFREKLSWVNRAGILLSFVAIYFLIIS